MAYFDNANSTQVDERVIEAMLPYFREWYGTAGLELSHAQDVGAVTGMENARKIIADSLNADPKAIIFTSGQTESNNLATRGIARANKKSGRHIITTPIETQSVLKSCERLSSADYEISFLDVDEFGLINLEQLKTLIREDTVLVSIQHGNAEIGTLQPIEDIAKITKSAGILFHTDASQTYMKVPIDTEKTMVDLITIDAHLIHGPKGVGALYIRRGTRIDRLHEGGDEERRLRPGVENIPAIVGFGKAVEIWRPEDVNHIEELRLYLTQKVEKGISDIRLTGHQERRIPGLFSMLVEFIEGESMLVQLDMFGFSVSTGSACSSKTLQGSHILKAIGLPPELSHGSLRVSFSRFNTKNEIDEFIETLIPGVERLREFSPIKQGEYFANTEEDEDHHHDIPEDDW
ncbi:MAG: cysteine desulfurase family protein [Candidatus Thorarchaeota archaeon]|nr:cysteine desulfurase family protein [Candidatus Thorarchaeota archaeon]